MRKSLIGILLLGLGIFFAWHDFHAPSPVVKASDARFHRAKPPILRSARAGFYSHIPASIRAQADRSWVARELLNDYGAMYVARGVKLPPGLIFSGSRATQQWQHAAPHSAAQMDGIRVVLQTPALRALLAARAQARREGLRLEPRGPDAARRGFAQTARLWESRVRPALVYWRRQGRLAPAQAEHIARLSPVRQVPVVLRLERQGIWFSTDFNKTILDSVAAPGTSQHIAMLAFDLREYSQPRLWKILNQHGWFQTITTDLPHFTYLGWPPSRLPGLGLRRVRAYGHIFWIPNLPAHSVQSMASGR